ncbi:hypothetical protein B9479_002371 [Cryptococcus floricola]|uniref:Uncharacterized protein n=1 Tax=Cryptococcus floricola TaxID=2591691 RepID=A0A5D3B3V1_9TREE|nr:hypothetical protein B9479_002371 [Cryptococcus floricola]
MSFILALLIFGTVHQSAHGYLVNSSLYSSGALGPSPAQTFHSINWTAPDWNSNVYPSNPADVSPGYIFIPPRSADVKDPSGVIYTNDGQVVWHGKDFGIEQTSVDRT